jgi:hypothetical protein
VAKKVGIFLKFKVILNENAENLTGFQNCMSNFGKQKSQPILHANVAASFCSN